jgi:6-phosphogluconolactonase/glucosamine-6-phosphate isomerase/deaminase
MALHAPQAAGSPDRLTLTRSALSRIGRVILLITGEEKRVRLEQALQHDDAPVSALFSPNMPAPDVLWAA